MTSLTGGVSPTPTAYSSTSTTPSHSSRLPPSTRTFELSSWSRTRIDCSNPSPRNYLSTSSQSGSTRRTCVISKSTQGRGAAVKFTLKDYQADAVEDVLANLKRARQNFKNPDRAEISSFSLAATTGAGKTVMAAAAIEALFWGNDAFDFEADPGAVVLWFSDDPSLNKQTFNRLRQASEKFTYSNLVPIEPPFAKPRLDPGKVYFLNTQKLTKSSLLTRGHVENVPSGQGYFPSFVLAAADMQSWTIWETLANTIEADDLTLYLVLDEAHRGFNTKTSSDKPTIVRRLVNGTKARPPVPIVWGISATIDHFNAASADGRSHQEPTSLAAGGC